jgi:uncharacterized protein (TIGR02147 family)
VPSAATPARAAVDVFRFLDYRAFLTTWYETKKKRLSYRAFSKRAGLGAPNYLQLVIAGQRNLTRATAERFAAACGLVDDRKDYFLTLVAFNQARSDAERNRLYSELAAFRRYRQAHKLELADARYHAHWYLPAIRELVHCPTFREDADWIAARLLPPITAKQASDAIDTLLELGLLGRNDDGKLCQRERVVSTGAETQGLHIRNYHAEMMHRATRAMELVPREDRDISTLTVSGLLLLARTRFPQTLVVARARRREWLRGPNARSKYRDG